jgi:tape measure domain-containing protein
MASNNLEYTLRLKDLFSKTMQGAANQVKGLDSKMSGLKNTLGGIKGAVAGAFATAGIVSFAKSVFDALDNAQKFHASIKTMLYGNEGAAKALERQLIQLAKTTPFQLTEVQDASKQLLAYGFKAGELVDTMRTLGDVSSGIGAPLGDIAYLYGTLKTSGRVTLMDLRQFAGRGIPIYETLAKRLKTTTTEINNMVSAGKIGFKDVQGAFRDMTKEGGQFFNLMADQSKTVGGQLSNLGDSWEQLKVKIGQSQTGIIASTTSWLNNMLDSVNRGIDAMNLLDKAFKGTESSQYSFYQKYIGRAGDKFNMMFGGKAMSGGYEEMRQYADAMKSNLGDTSKDKLSAATNNEKISNIIRNIFADASMSYVEKNRRVGILQEIRKQNLESMGLFGMKENKGVGSENGGLDKNGTSTSKSLGTGTEVTGQRPQSLTINITKLVESLNVQTTNMTEGATKIKEMVSKALLEAVNDANLTAMA